MKIKYNKEAKKIQREINIDQFAKMCDNNIAE